jgi:hypothetical protein
MTHDATRLMEEALKAVKLDGSFDPDRIGAKIGLRKPQAEAAARELSNAGVLVLGFDCAAHFSPDFKKARARAEGKASAHGRGGKPGRKAATASAARGA